MITVSNSVHIYKGLCGGCVFVAAKCAEDEITECPYYAVEVGNVAKPNACPQLCEVIDEWIRDLETEDIYILPKLLIKMKEFRVKHFA